MNTILLNTVPNNLENTIVLILPSSYKYQENTPFALVDFFSNELLVTKTLISKQTLEIQQIPDMFTYLALNVNSKLFYQITKEKFKKRLSQFDAQRLNEQNPDMYYQENQLYSFIKKDTLMDVLVFTDKCHIKELNNVEPFDIDVSKSLLSNKTVLSKNYCHPTKWNYLQQRPFTEQELIDLKFPK